MQRIHIKLLSVIGMMFVLTGCLFPQSELEKNKTPNEDQLAMVQTAVENYKEISNGLLPIKTKDSDVNIYEKYLIDFSILKDENLLSEIPGNAFENGGIYQYTITSPEDDPRVKLIDLRTTEHVRKVNTKLDIYRNKNFYPPYGEKIEKDLYQINYEKLGLKEAPHVTSPFSQASLPIVMNTDGELYIDYRIDLNQALNEEEHNYTEGEDIRDILLNESPFVPAYSLPYTVKDGEPVFMID